MKTKKYIFNQLITFNVDMGNLNLSESSDNDAIPIANPAQRLLLLLIGNQGQVVSREEIFKKVWDDYGLISSNNNLNQCVSRLRKVIRTLGIESDFIVTVPKIGFMLDPEIRVDIYGTAEVEMPPSPVDEDDAEETEQFLTQSAGATETARRRHFMPLPPLRSMYTGAVCAITVFFGWLAFTALKPAISSTHSELFLGNINSCKVFLSNSGTNDGLNSQLKQDLLHLASSYSMDCKGNEFLVLRQEKDAGQFVNGVSRFQLNKCTSMQDYKTEVCSNHMGTNQLEGISADANLQVIHPATAHHFVAGGLPAAMVARDDAFRL